MIHGPCGKTNPKAQCMKTHECDKDFPKPFAKHTLHGERKYPSYRRRSSEEGGNTANIYCNALDRNVDIDNQWVVPYNPVLLLKYGAHINVEIVASVGGLKYLFKYITKGCDRVMVETKSGMAENEILTYMNARYTSTTEAFWRIFGFNMSDQYPSVQRLAIHLPNEQQVYFEEGENPAEAAERCSKTTLTEYFTLNRNHPEARVLKYPDVLHHYTWNTKEKKFYKRKQRTSRLGGDCKSDTIGRIAVIALNSHSKELYYLRMLLYHRPGALSYEDLRRVTNRDGTVEMCDTYHEACIKHGLCEDDEENKKAMAEAATIHMPKALRRFFVTLTMHAMVANPNEIFDAFKVELCEDYMHHAGVTEPTEEIVNQVLLDLKELFAQCGADMAETTNLPEPRVMSQQLMNENPREVQDELDLCVPELADMAECNVAKLNTKQRELFDLIINSVDNDLGLIVALDACGGTGKTFVLDTLLSQVHSQGKIAIATAISGIAANLLPGGRTVHSKLKVPIILDEKSLCSIKEKSARAELVRRAELLIIDEVTMGAKLVYETVDRTLKKIRKNEKPFGGITTILSGDWRQCLPVVPRAGRSVIVSETLKASQLMTHIETKTLTQNMRIMNGKGDEEFSKQLLKIGEGREETFPDIGEDMIKIPANMKSKSTTLAAFCKEIFPDIKNIVEDGLRRMLVDDGWASWMMERAIISPTNLDCEEVNKLMIREVSGQPYVYYSFDKVLNQEKAHMFTNEFLNSIQLASMPPHVLELKHGSPIMLLTNLDPKRGHVNGARYYVKKLSGKVIHAVLAIGPNKGEELFIPRIKIHPSDKTIPFEMERCQFPVRLCFGITSNKSQGQTFKRAGIYLKNPFFSHGQLYVAMSRVGSPEALSIFKPTNKDNPKEADYTRNVVYTEVLSKL